jgi:hypothetical protein
MKRLILVVLITALAMPTAAWAQETAAPPKGVRVSGFPVAYVLDDKGVETKGGLFRIDEKSVILLVNGVQREFELAHVQRVTRRGDSLKNGAIVGAIFGGLVGILASGLAECRNGNGYGACGGPTRVAMFVGTTAFYTTVGVGIDALIQGRTVVFQAPPRTATRRIGGQSIGFSVSW